MPYDELFTSGKIRILYRKQIHGYASQSAADHARNLTRAKKCVNGDSSFFPLVRVMRSREFERIELGIKQRGRALQMFLDDHFFGARRYAKAGVVSEHLVAQIQSRYKRSHPPIALRRENIQFWYGPDLVRGNDGKFWVIEDNIGFVGGVGDLNALAGACASLGVKVESDLHPRTFYQEMVEYYQSEARRHGGGKIILLSYPQSQLPNFEDQRLIQALGPSVTNVTNHRTLSVTATGVFHQGERVGFVIINVCTTDIEPLGSKKTALAGFWEMVGRGFVGVSYVPNLEFAGDKQFCKRVEALVKFYLNEKCLLPSLGVVEMDRSKSLKQIREQREQWVVKSCQGQGGKHVWIGAHLSQRAWKDRLDVVKRRPTEFIAQRYCEPSQFLSRAVDIRPIALIAPQVELVSPFCWGRAAKGEKGKTNMARGGMFAPVATIP